MSSSSARVNLLALAILLLSAALALCFGLLVVERGKHFDASRAAGAAALNKAVPGATYRWKMVTTWPKNFPGLGYGPEYFADIVRKMTAGQLDIQVHGAGELVPAFGVFDAVSSGSVEMGHGAAYYWKGKISAAPFFTAVPFGMNAQEINAWVHFGGGLELWRELYRPFGVIPFAGGNTGVQMAGWFNKEVRSLDDLEGLNMRIPGIAGEVFDRSGGVALTIPGGELYTSMQTGRIDATEWVGPYNDMSFGLHEVGQYYYFPGWHEPGSMLEFIVGDDAWNSLPAHLQSIIEAAARATNQNMLDEFTARNSTALQTLKDRHGIELQPLSDEILQHFRRTADEYYLSLSAEDPAFAKVYDSYREFQRRAEHWHRVSEEAYYQSRK